MEYDGPSLFKTGKEGHNMVDVTLREITPENWRACVKLQVADDQKNFVATNAISLVQAAYGGGEWQPRAIYADETMVGFVLYGVEHYEGKDIWFIMRLMIDTTEQGKGYGSAAMHAVLTAMRTRTPQIPDVYISFVPENETARHVYSKLGFVDVGRTPDGSEILMHRVLAA